MPRVLNTAAIWLAINAAVLLTFFLRTRPAVFDYLVAGLMALVIVGWVGMAAFNIIWPL